MRHNLLLLALAACDPGVVEPIEPAPPGPGWQIAYVEDVFDMALDIVALDDGGSIVVGDAIAADRDDRDAFITRLDAGGGVLWHLRVGDLGEESARTALVTGGEVLVIGSTSSAGQGESDLLLLRVSLDGQLIEQTTYGGPGEDNGWDILPLEGGDLVLVGSTASWGAGRRDLWLLRLDALGQPRWQLAHGGAEDDMGRGIALMDGDLALLANTHSFAVASTAAWLERVTPDGELVWSELLDGDNYDYLLGIAPHRGGVALAGWTASFGSLAPGAWFTAVEPDGSLGWQHILRGEEVDQLDAISALDDGTLLAVGATWSSGNGGKDLLYLRLSGDGDLVEQQTLGGGQWDWGHGVTALPEGRARAAGHSESYVPGALASFVVELPPTGTELCDDSLRASAGLTLVEGGFAPQPVSPTIAPTAAEPTHANLPLQLTDWRATAVCPVEPPPEAP